MEYITEKELKSMFISAYNKVRDNREIVNKINVFPVPDQDTGNNLTRTLKGINDTLQGYIYKDIHELRSHILDSALASASGNIGIIMTGFISGFLSSFPSKKVNIKHIAEGMKEGSCQAFESIQDPKKGTILDVIQACSDSFLVTGTDNDIVSHLKNALTHSQIALKETQEQMEIYKNMSTVDAGAYGFVLLLEGFLDGLQNSATILSEEKDNKISDKKTKSFIQILSNRYEVISLLESPSKSKREILLLLEELGNSIDIVEANDKVKIHIHTDYPDEVVKNISSYGEILQMRTYDMTKGPEEYDKEGVSIGFVTDDAASLPLVLSTKLDIIVVPFQTSWEKADIDPLYKGKSIYEQMREIQKNDVKYGWPKTSQPPPRAYYQAFNDQLRKYRQVLCITVSSGVSGAYNSALQARKMLSEEDQKRVCIPDLRQGGGGQGIQILEAHRLTKIGINMDDIIKRLTSLIPKIKLEIYVSDPIWAVEGGRVSKFQGKILAMLRMLFVHPIFTLIEGKVKLGGFQWGQNIIAQRVHQKLKGLNRNKKTKIVISHANNPAEVEYLKRLLSGMPYEILYESQLPPVLGIHAGPDSIVIAYI